MLDGEAAVTAATEAAVESVAEVTAAVDAAAAEAEIATPPPETVAPREVPQ